jgi:hypothetical protein
MSPVALSALLAFLAVSVNGQSTTDSSLTASPTITAAPTSTTAPPVTDQFPATPLASKHFAYPGGIPYQADTDDLLRGTQFGYNLCNSTTENQNSDCQTSFLNSLSDFCLWAPPKPNSTIADTEGEEVAWCTQPGRGTRLIPAGALTGVQFMRTPDYVQVVGFIDQTKINMADGDYGGELDPHGADFRGNPLGGLVYSTAWSSDPTQYEQVIEWHNFMGGNAFCFKVCDPAGPNAANFCQHIYDRIGCAYNAPNNAQNGTFESCLGDDQDYPGVYTSNGVVMTYTQPAESLGAISTMPYQPRVPASSSCTTFSSAQLYASLPTVSSSTAKATSTGTGLTKATASGSSTSSRSAGAPAATSGASSVVISSFALFGAVFAAVLLS